MAFDMNDHFDAVTRFAAVRAQLNELGELASVSRHVVDVVCNTAVLEYVFGRVFNELSSTRTELASARAEAAGTQSAYTELLAAMETERAEKGENLRTIAQLQGEVARLAGLVEQQTRNQSAEAMAQAEEMLRSIPTPFMMSPSMMSPAPFAFDESDDIAEAPEEIGETMASVAEGFTAAADTTTGTVSLPDVPLMMPDAAVPPPGFTPLAFPPVVTSAPRVPYRRQPRATPAADDGDGPF